MVTQAVDLDHPLLGFFHAWTVALSRHVESIEIICLFEGRHDLPGNVRVHSLGKEVGAKSRIVYVAEFLRLIWLLRRSYDAVFVHMNDIYCVLGGWLWRLLGKRVVLWRNHLLGSFQTRVAAIFCDAVLYTSDSSYVARFAQAKPMPIGIDTELFKPGEPSTRGSILFLGRLDPVKRPEVFLNAMRLLAGEHPDARADVVGDPSPQNQAFAQKLQREFALPNIAYHAGVTNREAAAVYRIHQIYVNLTPAGSFDKTIGEAMASGCFSVVANSAVEDAPGVQVLSEVTPHALARALGILISLDPDELRRRGQAARTYVQEYHSLSHLVDELLAVLWPKTDRSR